MIKLVSFDIWKTLMDLNIFYEVIAEKLAITTGKPHQEIASKIKEAYKAALEARLRGEFKRPVYDAALFFARYMGISVEHLFIATAETVFDERIGNMAYPDAEPALKMIKEKGIKIAYLGNVMFWPGVVTRILLHRNNLLKYADITFFGDEIGVQKPEKKIFQLLAETARCQISEILHVGDSPENDFAGALLAGANAVLIKRDIEENIVVISEKAYIVEKLTLVPEIIERIGLR